MSLLECVAEPGRPGRRQSGVYRPRVGKQSKPPYADGTVILVPSATGALFLTSAALPVVTVVDETKHVSQVNVTTGVATPQATAASLPSAATPPPPPLSRPQPGAPAISLSSSSGTVGSTVTVTVSDCTPLTPSTATTGLSTLIFTDSAGDASHHQTTPQIISPTTLSGSSVTAQWTVTDSTTLGYGTFVAHCGDGSTVASQGFAVMP